MTHRFAIGSIKRNFCQTTTVFERITPDAGHGIGDSYARQATTTLERIIPDAVHRVADGYARQASTACVFASCFISAICKLNGRKVTTVICKRTKTIKI